jgi:tetratricopeptide (TPR) repeat protein
MLCAIGLLLMALGRASTQEPRLEPGGGSPQLVRRGGLGPETLQAATTVAKPALTVDVTPDRARRLLADMLPLRLPTHGSTGDEVKSTLLCFCLLKGPETVRELRRLAAEKFIQGVDALANGHPQLAAEAFSQAIQRHPREARAFANRGLAYARLLRYQESEADLTQAIALHETLAEAYYLRALIAILTGDHDGANANLQHAVRLGDERALSLSQMHMLSVREDS